MFRQMSQGRRVLWAYYIGMAVGVLIAFSVMLEIAADRSEAERVGEAWKWRGMYRQSLNEKLTEKASKASDETNTSAAPGNE